MEALKAKDMLRLWERGQGQRPLERALTLLSVAWPEKTYDELACLSVGRRDACLLAVRERTFGTTLDCFIDCAQCAEPLEFTASTNDIRAPSPSGEGEPGQEGTLEAGEYRIRYRLPDSHDLRTIAGMSDVAAARRSLLDRCIVQADGRDGLVDVAQLPETVTSTLSRRLAECDPQADTLLDICCPSCGHQWQALFEINEFFWTELADYARHLLREVHMLARAYCWREADILAMTTRRRQQYLEVLRT